MRQIIIQIIFFIKSAFENNFLEHLFYFAPNSGYYNFIANILAASLCFNFLMSSCSGLWIIIFNFTTNYFNFI